MKIQKISQSTNFQSGLTRKIIAESKAINPSVVEVELARVSGINAKFNEFKPNAYCVKKIIEIFNSLNAKSERGAFKIGAPNIRIYAKEDLVSPFTGYGFCLPESRKVLKNEEPFETGSIFYQQEKSIEVIDMKAEFDYKQKRNSSSHFLAPIFHEIFHEKYVDYIYKKYGYNGQCSYTRQKYPAKDLDFGGFEKMKQLEVLSLDNNENEVIKNVLGSYSTEGSNQYHEIFAETFAKLFCDALSENLTLQRNPLEDLKKYPKEFLQIFNKILKV